MDFGGFIIFILGALACLVGFVIVSVQWITRHPSRIKNLRRLGIGLGLLALAGLYLYKAYYLDEGVFVAASNQDATEVRRLLSLGADPNAQWEDGTRAIEIAKKRKNKEIVDMLRRAGAYELTP